MIRRSSSPCSFFAAWYSKFSERSPCPRAVAIASIDRLPLRAFELGELSRQLLVLRTSELLALLLGHQWPQPQEPPQQPPPPHRR